MRAADLLGVDAVDEQGRHLGKVRDLRLVSSADGGPWRLEGLILGPSGIGYRLGYASGQVGGPAVLAALARLLCRRARYLPWTRVAGWNGQQLIVCGAGSDLPGPPRLSHDRRASRPAFLGGAAGAPGTARLVRAAWHQPPTALTPAATM